MKHEATGTVRRVALVNDDVLRCVVSSGFARLDMPWNNQEPIEDLIALNVAVYKAPRAGSSVTISWDDGQPEPPSSNSGR